MPLPLDLDGAIVLDSPEDRRTLSPTGLNRLLAACFPELPEAAAVAMGGTVPRRLTTDASGVYSAEPRDRDYDNFKYFLRKRNW